MDLKEKVTEALQEFFHPDHVELEDEDGISGFVVSERFKRVTALDRQILIDEALRKATRKFSKPELRRVLAIAGITPTEYEALGRGAKSGLR
jgi:hypothetical protein